MNTQFQLTINRLVEDKNVKTYYVIPNSRVIVVILFSGKIEDTLTLPTWAEGNIIRLVDYPTVYSLTIVD